MALGAFAPVVSAPGVSTPATADAGLPDDVAFLEGRLPRALLEDAAGAAETAGCQPHQILLDHGRLTAHAYYTALASAVGARFTPFVRLQFPADPFVGRSPAEAAQVGMLMVCGPHGPEIAAAPRGRQVAAFVAALREQPEAARQILLTTPQALVDAVVACGGGSLLASAMDGLGTLREEDSARVLLRGWQAAALTMAPAVCLLAAIVAPHATLLALTAILAVFFLGVIGLRLVATALALVPGRARRPPVLADAQLPVYTVLVPLRGEAHMVGPLVRALGALDYPRHKLDIKIVAEANDPATLAALHRHELPAHFEVVTVPNAGPKTKPKALCFALGLARGSLLTIFDAEDRPEPEQLRLAAAHFAAAPGEVACLQARLAWYNWPESWFTRQLAIEYAALFDAVLPALARLRLPLPLGGTSNHFRTSILRETGAWDAFNLTEDADLGLRLARRGYRCEALASTTWEEAPVSFGAWLRQRTRWLKGWMQTWLVHMRRPAALLSDLGPLRFVAMQAIFGGVVVSAFAHPIFVAVVSVQILRGDIFGDGEGLLQIATGHIGAFNLVAGYAAGLAIGLVALRRRALWWLVPELVLMPVYWLTISLAAIRAAWQLVRAPHLWEKTEHGVSRLEPHPADTGRVQARRREHVAAVVRSPRREDPAWMRNGNGHTRRRTSGRAGSS